MNLPPVTLDRVTLSQISGTISITCWIIVFIPQIYKIFKEKSARGLSLHFIVIWLLGDIFNVLGAIKQKLLLTVILLAIYYTVADIVLFLQWIWYSGYSKAKSDMIERNNGKSIKQTSRDLEYGSITNVLSNDLSKVISRGSSVIMSEETQPLLENNDIGKSKSTDERISIIQEDESEIFDNTSTDLVLDVRKMAKDQIEPTDDSFYNFICAISVFVIGTLSWYISYCSNYYKHDRKIMPVVPEPNIRFNFEAQVFGYISAALYLLSRIPQILLNYKRKSCDGVSFLFFLFACMGNFTFIFSILIISMNLKYIEVNFAWLLGSAGTLLMDLTIFGQFFLYKKKQIST